MDTLYKSVLLRFVRAFVAGAVANMLTVMTLTGNSWGEFKTWLLALVMSAIIGGISGFIMAADKYLRSAPMDVR